LSRTASLINLAPIVPDGQLPLLPLPPRIRDSPERLEAMGTGAAEAAGAGAAGPSGPVPTRFEFGPGPLGLGLSDAAGGGAFVSEVHSGGAAERLGMRVGCLVLELAGVDVRHANKQVLASRIGTLPRPLVLITALETTSTKIRTSPPRTPSAAPAAAVPESPLPAGTPDEASTPDAGVLRARAAATGAEVEALMAELASPAPVENHPLETPRGSAITRLTAADTAQRGGAAPAAASAAGAAAVVLKATMVKKKGGMFGGTRETEVSLEADALVYTKSGGKKRLVYTSLVAANAAVGRDPSWTLVCADTTILHLKTSSIQVRDTWVKEVRERIQIARGLGRR
jgi:hypothetical protein